MGYFVIRTSLHLYAVLVSELVSEYPNHLYKRHDDFEQKISFGRTSTAAAFACMAAPVTLVISLIGLGALVHVPLVGTPLAQLILSGRLRSGLPSFPANPRSLLEMT